MGRIKTRLLAAAMVLVAGALSTPAAAQENIKGIIVSHTNGTVVLKTPEGDQHIPLAPHVRVRSISGALGGQKDEKPLASLIPGLSVTVDVENGHATEIDYKAKDYKTAAQIQAGTQATREQAAANEARSHENARQHAELRSAYSKMGEWDVRAETNVYFATGSAALTPKGKDELMAIARKANGIKGYAISVLGYADPRGDEAANERLSNRRAQAVINYLKQSGHIQPGRVLAASAMGESQMHGAGPAPTDHQSARRVTVRVVTSSAHLSH